MFGVFHSIKEGKLMKLKATLTLVAASLFLAACDQSGSAAKETAKAETAKPQAITRLCTVRQKHHLALAQHW